MRFGAVLLLILGAGGVETQAEDLAGADRVVVYYFNKDGDPRDRIYSEADELSTTVEVSRALNGEDKRALVDLIKAGGPPHMPYLCFKPRHAFVFEYADGSKRIPEICFDCLGRDWRQDIETDGIDYLAMGRLLRQIGLSLGPEMDIETLESIYTDSVKHARELKKQDAASK